jgi:DNA-binding NarL/FixJ family response regulator
MGNRMLELISTGMPGHGSENGVEELSELPAPRGILLFIVPPGVVSESLLHAARYEFPYLMIKQVERIAAASVAFAHPVALMLIDASLLTAEPLSVKDLAHIHPHALTAAIQPRGSGGALADLVSSRLVRGVLPMDVALDVWLSVIRLLLHGGEYFPLDFVVRSYAKGMAASESQAEPDSPPAPRVSPGPTELTARELQILEMVSRGLPNKGIAADLRLSEHTVKIHIHNIITKLGVHNRTEAVSRFRDESWKSRRAAGPSR